MLAGEFVDVVLPPRILGNELSARAVPVGCAGGCSHEGLEAVLGGGIKAVVVAEGVQLRFKDGDLGDGGGHLPRVTALSWKDEQDEENYSGEEYEKLQ